MDKLVQPISETYTIDEHLIVARHGYRVLATAENDEEAGDYFEILQRQADGTERNLTQQSDLWQCETGTFPDPVALASFMSPRKQRLLALFDSYGVCSREGLDRRADYRLLFSDRPCGRWVALIAHHTHWQMQIYGTKQEALDALGRAVDLNVLTQPVGWFDLDAPVSDPEQACIPALVETHCTDPGEDKQNLAELQRLLGPSLASQQATAERVIPFENLEYLRQCWPATYTENLRRALELALTRWPALAPGSNVLRPEACAGQQ